VNVFWDFALKILNDFHADEVVHADGVADARDDNFAVVS
jgi:hypothetical protein